MTDAVLRDTREALAIEKALIPDVVVGEIYVRPALQLRGDRRLEEVVGTRRACFDRFYVAVAHVKDEAAVLAEGDVARRCRRVCDDGKHREDRADREQSKR